MTSWSLRACGARRRVASVVVAAVALVPRVSRADWPDQRDQALPCRPTIACTADIVAPGTFEVESGFLFRRVSGRARVWTYPILAKQTFTEALQLQVGTNGYTTIESDVPRAPTASPLGVPYLDDVTVGPKLHLHDQTSHVPSLAVSAQASIPTVHRQGYLRTYDALFTGYATKDIGPIHADLNAGLNLWRVEDRPLPQVFTAFALSMNLVRPFGAMIEGYVFSDAAPVSPRDGGFLFALSHSPRPWLVFDVGGDIGFFPSTHAFSTFIGMTMIPVILWRPAAPRL